METTILQILSTLAPEPGVRISIDFTDKFMTVHVNFKSRTISHKCSWAVVETSHNAAYIVTTIKRLIEEIQA